MPRRPSNPEYAGLRCALCRTAHQRSTNSYATTLLTTALLLRALPVLSGDWKLMTEN